MKILEQTRPDLARLAELIGDIDVAMLATHARTGDLESRPMAPIEMDGAGAFWFFTRRDSPIFDGQGPVNLAFIDHARARYVSVCGSAAQIDDRARIRALWTPLARPWFPEGADAPDLTLLRVLPHSADIWDAPNSRMLRVLALAASVAAGHPVGLGGHEHLDPELPGAAPWRPAGAT
jgi:general stress protein 26